MMKKYLVFYLMMLFCLSAFADSELLDAVKREDTAKVKELLGNHTAKDIRVQKAKNDALFEAVENNYIEIVKMLLENGADPNSMAYEKYSVLYIAAGNSTPEIVKLLVGKGAKLDSQSGAVTLAAKRRQQELLEWLINNGGDINEDFSPYSQNPLNTAINNADIKTIRFLISKGADVNHVHKITGNTPLIIAASANQGKAVKLLLENGADASFKNKNGQAPPDFAKTDEVRMIFILADKATGPFFKAVLAGDIQEIKRKLGEGFDVNTRDVTGSVALIHSASAGDIEMVKLLLSYKADVNAYDNRGTSALSAAAKTRKGDIVKMLLAEGAEPNSVIESIAKDKADSPLISAIKANDFSIVKDLIAAGALVNEVSSDLRSLTPLLAACKFGSGEMVDFLIGKDAKLDVVDSIGFSPLITAVSAGRIDIVKLLWQKYKQPLFSGNRWTALGVACDNGKVEMVKFLVENGADVNIVSQEYKISPLMTAYRNPEITEYLIKHGAEIEHEGGILNSTALSLAIRDDQTFLSLKQLENVKLPPGISEIQTKKLAETHSRQLAVVEVLLKAGADQNHKDKSGKSPRDYANNPDIKALLKKYNKR